ncbi:glycosyltransferase [Methylobacterium bullatum]|uniref:Glycosyltransferase family 1 protein n=1 Tax=Methylobacterium bullatum TaxID=570505 RepID=A0A679K294_9HYPH|nr:glycosyltransferase [Methylobacterium bullatum]MBD8901591.1 hypothetical protein [Methylobacterium bullatum]GJD38281.1 hypothetical protein OICFNHDK_0725 [Methylobacterium bullatum]CAA2141098.1 hypothetical protein MBLL_02459 [Methylobacterium bullatum]
MSGTQPVDPYWAALLAFLDEDGALLAATAAPDGLKEYRPDLIAFSDLDDIPSVRQVVCHKGLIEQIPVRLLAASFGRAKLAFSNEVFVVFRLGHSESDHVRSFEIDLANHLSSSDLDAGQPAARRKEVTRPLLRRPVASARGVGVPRIVAALQSPTLLNNWASAGGWNLEAAKLGDHDGLAESALLQVPSWDGSDENVAAVLVTTPLQLEEARTHLPNAAHIWIIHNGRAGLLPPKLIDEVDGVITLSRKVLALQRTHHPALLHKPSWVIAPWYEPERRYRWSADRAWTMKSRPNTRDRYDLALTHQVIELAKRRSVDIVMYGQDTVGGFLDGRAKDELQSSCSCYVSPLPPWAGFGLAQHECLSGGVPLAGLLWGDLKEDLPAPYPALTETLDDLAETIRRLCTEEAHAEAVSEAGLDYIAQARTKSRTERAIERFLDEVGGA